MKFKHILSQMGVLKTFSIARHVSEDDVKKLTDKYTRLAKKDISLTEYLRREMAVKMQQAFMNNKVPGLIFDNIEPTHEEHSKMMDLTQFASLVAKKLVEKKLNKFYYCFIIHSLVNMLGLNDEDFNEFHKRFSRFKEGEEEV
jgi:hypothetical protein